MSRHNPLRGVRLDLEEMLKNDKGLRRKRSQQKPNSSNQRRNKSLYDQPAAQPLSANKPVTTRYTHTPDEAGSAAFAERMAQARATSAHYKSQAEAYNANKPEPHNGRKFLRLTPSPNAKIPFDL